MKICFASNFLNHHQLYLCQEFQKITDNHFVFVATTPTPEERLQLGYHDMNHQYPFVIEAYLSEEKKQEALRYAMECDVLIMGAASEEYMIQRLKAGKITFNYAERPYKQPITWKNYLRRRYQSWKHNGRFQKYPYYVLCAGAYVSGDYARFGYYRDKAFKWGYFPEIREYDMENLWDQKRRNEKIRILWAGRLIDWKHPETCIEIAGFLKSRDVDFELSMIGTGEMERSIEAMISENGLQDCVHMLGAMSPEQVREHMEQSHIYVFTSDYQEGWGAVLNESMNSGCAVVASHAIGAAGYLLQNGKNGFIYPDGDQDALNRLVYRLTQDRPLCEQLGKAAYHSLCTQWNFHTAAERLTILSEYLEHGGRGTPFQDGICSSAEIMTNSNAVELLCR